MSKASWSDEAPAEPGHYWMRIRGETDAGIAFIFRGHGDVWYCHSTRHGTAFVLHPLTARRYEWAGPILPPL
jgi:hypothetical protein